MTKAEMIIDITSQGFEVHQLWFRNEDMMTLGIKLRAYPKRRKDGRMYQIEQNFYTSHVSFWANPEGTMNTIEVDLITALYNEMKKQGEL